MSNTDVHGTVADGFEAVRDEFAAVVAEQDGEVGAQLAAYVRGRRALSGVAFGYARRRFSFNWSHPEHDRLAAAVHRAATAS